MKNRISGKVTAVLKRAGPVSEPTTRPLKDIVGQRHLCDMIFRTIYELKTLHWLLPEGCAL